MSNTLDIIKQELYTKPVVNSISRILGGGRGKEYVTSVIAEIHKSSGGKNDLTLCTRESIISAMRDAAKLRLSIDGRQHAHLIKYGNKATLQIGYRGYLARLQESLPGFSAQVECVYKGDTITVRRSGFLELVNHERADPFGARPDSDIIGVYAQLSYDAGNERVSHVVTMNRAEIDKIRACAKDQSFWNKWFTEKAKVACIRRACKMHFSAVTFDLDSADNDNFDHASRANGEEKAASINSRLQEEEMKVVGETNESSERA